MPAGLVEGILAARFDSWTGLRLTSVPLMVGTLIGACGETNPKGAPERAQGV